MEGVTTPLFQENDLSIKYMRANITNPTLGAIAFHALSFSFVKNNHFHIDYYYTITSNCQLGAFSNFQEILENSDNVKEDLKWFYSKMKISDRMKNLLLIDVREEFSDQVRDIFNGYIVMDNPYKSTNDSDMVLFMVKSKALAV